MKSSFWYYLERPAISDHVFLVVFIVFKESQENIHKKAIHPFLASAKINCMTNL